MLFKINGISYKVDINNFPAGEQGVVLPKRLPHRTDNIFIEYDWPKYKDSGIMVLAQLLDALAAKYALDNYKKVLLLKYVPYSRQDRVCNKGESHSLKVFTTLINSMEFDRVITWDNHSEVATSLLNNCNNIPQWNQVRRFTLWDRLIKGETMLVSPDAGAAKKTLELAKESRTEVFVRADKRRDTKTGAIISCEVIDQSIAEWNDNFLIVDDICDGGGTFIGLGEAIKKINPSAKLELFVTHGFFTKGLDKLLKLYDTIYTTDSVCRIKNDKLVII